MILSSEVGPGGCALRAKVGCNYCFFDVVILSGERAVGWMDGWRDEMHSFDSLSGDYLDNENLDFVKCADSECCVQGLIVGLAYFAAVVVADVGIFGMR